MAVVCVLMGMVTQVTLMEGSGVGAGPRQGLGPGWENPPDPQQPAFPLPAPR